MNRRKQPTFAGYKARLIEHEESGIIIYDQPYRVQNKIIRVLTTNKGIMNIIARGVRKMKSKNRYKLNLFDEINFTYFISSPKQKIYLLKKIHNVNRYSVNVLMNFKCAAVVADLTSVLLATELNYLNGNTLAFMVFHECLTNLNKWSTVGIVNFYNYYILKLLTIISIIFLITKCAACKKNKQIICLSFEGGGLICKKCAQYEHLPRDKIIYMQIFRLFYQEKNIESLDKIMYDEKFTNWLNTKLKFFISNYFMIKLSFGTIITNE